MNLEDTWQKQKAAAHVVAFDPQAKQKSISLVNRILGRLKLERGVVYIVGPFIILFPIYHQDLILAILSLLYVVGLFFYYRNLIGKMEQVAVEDSVATYLRANLLCLRRFKVHYILLGVVSFMLGFALVNDLVITDNSPFANPWIVLAAILAMGLSSWFSYSFHFGGHVNRMRTWLADLEKEE